MRCVTLRLSSQAAGRRSFTPYQVVLKAVEHDGRGLLAAAEVFKQFQRFYRSYQQKEGQRTRAASTSAESSSTTGDDNATAEPHFIPGKPLTQFCGRAEDVEPMTVLLLKVLCDLQKLEEMRFLFTQCLLEMEDRTPSVELFNVFLLAISMTDTFNQYEVENLVELQQSKGIVPDVVTKLSMFLLYLRLGNQNCVAWWPGIREEVEIIIDTDAVARYPLLPLRLQHCFQTLLRVHYDTAVIHESFELLHRAAPERVTPSIGLPYLLLSAMNMSTPPFAVVKVLKLMQARERHSSSSPTKVASEHTADTSSSSSSTATTAATQEPVLSSEITVFRLLAKCAKYGDADAAAYMRSYINTHRQFGLVAKENEPVAALLYVEALTKAGRVRSALRVLEREVPAPYNRPGERPKLFLQSRRLSLLSTDPVRNVVAALTPLVAAAHVEDPAVSLISEKTSAADAEEREPVPVTSVTLDLLLAACQFAGSAKRAEEVLCLYPRYETVPTSTTYALLLEVYAATAPVDGALRLPSLQREMEDAGIAVNAAWLHAAMAVALDARDIGAALRVAELSVAHKSSVDVKHGARLLRELAVAADAAAMRRALHLLRSSNSTVDSRSVALCTAVLRSLGVPAAALRVDAPAHES
ncbi:conserved hypothetical protein [Leishmania major strain Friedlin]|uniref:Pentacotripeptide-repeat region of PRORP domain-containing protein n=1 Tax=Leishmania major TaxID=5664 RepID=Q4Q6Y0_LEIMA|nr:conserved hypothetical protein [Leishmania major strain Friedlin]CAG9578549.1 hypothetical_protein_-_conserved [Leishmania major strain Friedlin]CAJ06723.1 conserved hypothetical protein [Leishmania major strain Friedlin]|eukprot:XP_001684918.1 conserved hypothetical protein [Leishmania major strain Friedlin]